MDRSLSPPDSAPRRGFHIPPHRAWLVLLVVTIVLRLPALLHPRAIDDEAIYAVVAHTMVDGGKPYVDAVERKPPLLFWVYQLVFELSGKYNWPALHATAIVWVLLTMLGVYIVAKRLFGVEAGLLAAFLYSLYQVWGTWKNLAFNGEMMMNLPIAWALVLTLTPVPSPAERERGTAGRWSSGASPFGRGGRGVRALVAGVLLASAFLLKQPAAIAAIPIGLYLLFCRSRTPSLGSRLMLTSLLTLAFSATLGGVALVLRSQGILEEAYFWTITHHDTPHGPLDPVFWIRAGRMSLAFAAACAPLAIGAMLMAKHRDWWRGRDPEVWTLVGLVIASAIGTAASGRFYPHYYIQLVLPLAVLAAPGLVGLRIGDWGLGPHSSYQGSEIGRERQSAIRNPQSERSVFPTPHWLTGLLAVTAIGFLTSFTVGLTRQRQPTDVGAYVRAHAAPDDRIFVWGQGTGIYLDARHPPATRYVATFPLTGYIFGSPLSWDPSFNTSDRIVPGAWDNFQEDIAQHPPMFIIDQDAVLAVPRYPASEFPVLRQLLAQYARVYEGSDGVVYHRRARRARGGNGRR